MGGGPLGKALSRGVGSEQTNFKPVRVLSQDAQSLGSDGTRGSQNSNAALRRGFRHGRDHGPT